MVFETSAERITLLKIGFIGTELEQMYIHFNDFKIINLCNGKDYVV